MRIFAPVFCCSTYSLPSLISSHLIAARSPSRCPVTSARSMQRPNHSFWTSAIFLINRYSSINSRLRFTSVLNGLVAEAGSSSARPEAIAVLKMSDKSALYWLAIANLLPAALISRKLYTSLMPIFLTGTPPKYSLMIFNLWLCLFMVFVLNCLRSISFLKFNISSQNNVTLLPFILSSKLICCVGNAANLLI